MASETKAQDTQKRPGRPRMPAEDVQGKFMSMRVTEELAEEIRRRGGSTWARDILIKAIHGSELRIDADINVETARTPTVQEHAAPLSLLDLRAACGFNSPATDTRAEESDLYELLVPHPADTILVEASGDSMVDAGIFEGDLLVVERTSSARSGQIVLACYDGNFIVKRLKVIDGKPELRSENDRKRYPILRPFRNEQFEIQGVVKHVIRSFH